MLLKKRQNNHMTKAEEDTMLEERIHELLDRAISLMPQKGRAIKLVGGGRGDCLYEVDARGIAKYWKDRHPERGYPVTKQEEITPEEFLRWLSKSDKSVVAEVHKNLLEYINTVTPKGNDIFDELKG